MEEVYDFLHEHEATVYFRGDDVKVKIREMTNEYIGIGSDLGHAAKEARKKME